MKTVLALLSCLYVISAVGAYAEEDAGGEGEHKAKAPEKPRPDSAISMVLSLPVVHKWDEWIASKHSDAYLAAWGESIKEVKGSECWSVVVAEVENNDTRIWKRFCVQKTGLEVWVEIPPADPADENDYYSYEKWVDKCHPTENSPGTC